jgi:virulence factor Mce-like protein
MQSLSFLRNPLTWGAIALSVATAITLAAALLYVSPPGQQTVAFYTDDAASLQPGDEVRIAGIPVGKVTDIALEPEQVRVQARVERSAFVGDKSQIEVRMLTVVGGYFVDLISLGDVPLGNNAIPVERVAMPYNLVRALDATVKVTEHLDATPINESLNQIQSGLSSGDNVEATT